MEQFIQTHFFDLCGLAIGACVATIIFCIQLKKEEAAKPKSLTQLFINIL